MIWEFIQNQILGMKWLNELIGNALTMMGLDINTRVGGALGVSQSLCKPPN